MRICSVCKLEKHLALFNKSKKGKDGINSMCKECAKVKKNIYRANNPDAEKESAALWREKNRQLLRDKSKEWRSRNKGKKLAQLHKRRATKSMVQHSKYSIEEVLEKYGNICHICNNQIDLTAPRKTGNVGWEYGLHLDHDIPLSRGGEDSIFNVKPAHGICNLSKRK